MSILDDVRNHAVRIDDFLEAQSETAIQKRMFSRVSPDLDISEGSYIWDSIVPTSFEHALVYMALRYALHLAFPQRSFGEHLSLHAEAHGTPRRAAQTATGHISVSGSPGIVIPSGTKFSTTVSDGSSDAPKYYTTTKTVTIPASEMVDVPISADNSGSQGNVRAGEINLNIQKLHGIFTVTNTEAIENGIDAEEDQILLSRMLERIQSPPSSGNRADYRRWAKEVPGVGDAIVQALWNGPGTVKVTIIGIDGNPVGTDVIQAVQEHIDPGESGEGEGMAPIGAHVRIDTVKALDVTIVIPSMEYEGSYSLNVQSDILSALEMNIRKYLMDIPPGGIIRLKEVEAVISDTSGVTDFKTITLNGGSANIQLAGEEKATLCKVVIA